MDWRRFLCHPDQRESGATLLGVVGIALVLSLLTASILSFTLQSAQAVLFNREHTQALYNARMGIDAAVELIDHELSISTPRVSPVSPVTGAQLTSLAKAVTSDLGELSSPPFQVWVSVATNVANTLSIRSRGFSQNAAVTLKMNGALSLPGSGSYQVSATGSDGSPNVSISGTGGAAVSVSGNGKSVGTVSVNGSTATVSGFPNQQNIQGDNHFFPPLDAKSDNKASVWVEGSYKLLFGGQPYDNLIVTGNFDGTLGNVKGTAIVTGAHAAILGNIGGPLIVAGSNALIYGDTHCAVITGNNVTVVGNVKGNLVITGNNVNIYGNIKPGESNGDVVVTGNNVTIRGNVGGHLIATGTNEVVWGKITKGLTAIGPTGQNVTVYRNRKVEGGLSQFRSGPIKISTACLGAVTVQSGADGTGNGGVTLIPSSSTVSG